MATKEKTSLATATKDLDAAAKALSEAIASDGQATGRAAFPDSTMRAIINFISQAKNYFAQYGTPLTPTDRKRLIGMGFKNQGFIERAYTSAAANPSLVPGYLNITTFKDDVDDYLRKLNLDMILVQFEREVSDAALSAGDVAYRDALEYYNAVKEAARQRVTGAEGAYNELKPYFKKSKPVSTEPTEKQLERDIHALLHGTKDGKVVIENERPSVAEGKHKVLDEVFSGRVAVKEDLEEVVEG
ncbi:MAG: hypothetical protein LBH19_12550 [Dysgonamonadaceae bacterium]|jgi:hypothetical protein|nr:hypothetical protein [Dysgonamonadaceae bacterium]